MTSLRTILRAILLVLVSVLGVACAAAPADEEPVTGTVAQAITNGDSDTNDDAVVALMVNGEVFCSGTLIANYMVVTAAHCVTPEPPDHVYFGSNPKNETGSFLVEVAQVNAHPKFDEDALTNDIAVVLLKTPAPVKPKAYASSSTLSDDDYAGLELRIVGFGATSAGQDSFKALKRDGATKIDSVQSASFKFVPSPSQTCNGDSGGPAFATLNGKELLVGVTSAGDTNCKSYGRDMRIDAYEDFIDGKMTEYRATVAAQASASSCSFAPSRAGSAKSGLVAFALMALVAVFRRRR